MFSRPEAILRIALWGAFLALVVVTQPVSAQDDVPAATDAAEYEDPAPDSPPGPNSTQRVITPRNDQSAEQQWTDEWECYDRACELAAWDPYVAYDDLVAAGYAVALYRIGIEDDLVRVAEEGAVVGTVAGEIAGRPRRGAELGVAIAIALELVRSDYLDLEDDPAATRAISDFERRLRDWDRKFAGCLRPRGYGVSSP